MSRQIKFRAWNKVADFMMPWEDFEGYSIDQRAIVDEYNVFGDSEFEIMQYTGLKDKNGRGIYEGDIIHTIGMMLDDKGIVKYIDGAYYVETFDGEDGWFLFHEIDENEVVGNIYENPELLGEEDE